MYKTFHLTENKSYKHIDIKKVIKFIVHAIGFIITIILIRTLAIITSSLLILFLLCHFLVIFSSMI